MTRTDRIARSVDGDLKQLAADIERMGEMVVNQMKQAQKAVETQDLKLAQKIIDKDPEIDALEHEIDTFAIRTIALRQPVARDLRAVIAALKISSHLERMADYATNMAKRAQILADAPRIPDAGKGVPRLSKLATKMVKDVLKSYSERDMIKAKAIWESDAELDEHYLSFIRELLTYMMEDPRNISACTQLLFIAKNIERIGDHATNIAELVHYVASGEHFTEPRPKGTSGE